MTYTLEIGDELILPAVSPWNDSASRNAKSFHTVTADSIDERLDKHREGDEPREEFIAELVPMYETEGAFLREGYSE